MFGDMLLCRNVREQDKRLKRHERRDLKLKI